MKRPLYFLVLLALPLSLFFVSPASAQAVKKGTVSGTAFMAAAAVASGTVPLYTAPTAGNGIAMITSVCGRADLETSSPTISGSTLGVIAIGITNGSGCTSIPHGMPLPAGEVLSYTNPFGSLFGVTISGVISKK